MPKLMYFSTTSEYKRVIQLLVKSKLMNNWGVAKRVVFYRYKIVIIFKWILWLLGLWWPWDVWVRWWKNDPSLYWPSRHQHSSIEMPSLAYQLIPQAPSARVRTWVSFWVWVETLLTGISILPALGHHLWVSILEMVTYVIWDIHQVFFDDRSVSELSEN